MHKLQLIPSFADDKSDKDIDNDANRLGVMQQRCPRLRDIRMRVRRRQGGPEKVAVYQALGRLPRLERATLVLDCNGRRIDWPGEGPERLRDIFVNFAVDETLARAIIREIASSMAAGHAPLQRLRLETREYVANALLCPDDSYWVSWLARSWMCVRHTKCGRGDGARDRRRLET